MQQRINPSGSDVAIIGMSCQLPGGVNTLDKLWDYCAESRCAAGPIPKARFDASKHHHPNGSKPGHFNIDAGSFIQEDIAAFDAPFFNLSEAEAKAIDPQHRLLLECGFTALENAGIDIKTIAGSKDVGVFASASKCDYETRAYMDQYTASQYTATGSALTMFANRLSYFFNLQGPSITVDTACSSSLTALHYAVESIRNGECNTAIVGGSFLQLSPLLLSFMSNLGALGKDGKSFSFDHRANGYGRGEGVLCVVLRTASDALAQGDCVRALIRNTGVNHAGRSHGITSPSGEAQVALIRQVYHSVGLDPVDTAFVEGHGTGTERGDPIEAESIAQVFCGGRQKRKSPLFLGSIKSNFGHLEGASGLLSVIKSVLMLERGIILPNANFEQISPAINLNMWDMRVPTQSVAWPENQVRRVSINNFGFGGSNAHIVLEQAPDLADLEDIDIPRAEPRKARRRLYIVSAKDQSTLQLQMDELSGYLERSCEHEDNFMRDLSYTLCCRRTHFTRKFITHASTPVELLEKLRQPDRIKRASTSPKLGFVFTGQGAQWAQMGMSLMSYPKFAEAMEHADQCLKEFGAKWSLLDEINKPTGRSRIDDAMISQPATTALQIALMSLLASWNIMPVSVCGHSSGEIAAAYAAGFLDARCCMALAYYRGEAASEIRTSRPEFDGAMMAVGAGPSIIQPLVQSLSDGFATVACYNSPSSVTVSGDRSALKELSQLLDEQQIFNRMLKVNVAYHSDHMIAVSKRYLERITPILQDAPTNTCKAIFFSSVNGMAIEPKMARSPWYWTSNLVCPVQFADALQTMNISSESISGSCPDVLLEIGPHAALGGPIRQILSQNKPVDERQTVPEHLSTLKREEDASSNMLDLVVSLTARGVQVDIAAVGAETAPATDAKMIGDLPPYRFNKTKRYWHETRQTKNFEEITPWNVLLGHSMTNSVGIDLQFRNVFKLDDIPWLRDHKVNGSVIFPMAGYISAAIEAQVVASAGKAEDIKTFLLREVTISKALTLSEEGQNELFTILRPQIQSSRSIARGSWSDFQVLSWNHSTGFSEHCRGSISTVSEKMSDSSHQISVQPAGTQRARRLRSELHRLCTRNVAVDAFYQKASEEGLQYGPAFCLLSDIHTGGDYAMGTVVCGDTRSTMPMMFETQLKIHPTVLDATLHTGLCSLSGNGGSLQDLRAHVPTFIREVSISNDIHQQDGSRFEVYFHNLKTEKKSRTCSGNITCFSGLETPIIDFREVQMFQLSEDATEKLQVRSINPLKIEWRDFPDVLDAHGLMHCAASKAPLSAERLEVKDIEQASYYIIEQALATLPAEPSRHHLKKLLSWMKATVEGAKDDSRSRQWLSLSETEKTDFVSRVGSQSFAGRWIGRVGPQLPAILNEKIEPLSVLLEENGLWRVYEESIIFQRSFRQVSRLISLLSHQNPGLRILEIGAGTGGCTSRILEELSSDMSLGPRFELYDYTDISTGFFEAAKSKFAIWGNVLNYKRLDISQDPIQQGLVAGSYDLVVAADVIHATPDIGQSLKHIRQLLKPNGILAMVELSRLSPLLFPFATLPGWWEREDGPIVGEREWNDLLVRSGFAGLDVSIGDFDDCQIHSVLWAHAPAPVPKSLPKVAIVYDESPNADLLLPLDQLLQDVTGKSPRHQTMRDACRDNGIFICLDEVVRPILTTLTQEQFQVFQKLLASAKGVLWVQQAPKEAAQAPLLDFVFGFARTLRLENAALKFVVLQLDSPERSLSAASIVKVFEHAFIHRPGILESDVDFREVDGRVQVPRLTPDSELGTYIDRQTNEDRLEDQSYWQEGRPLHATMGTIGLFNSLHFAPSNIYDGDRPLADDEVVIEIRASGLNFKDVLIALGSVPWQGLGRECSGVVIAAGKIAQQQYQKGDAVVHWGEGLFSTHARCTTQTVAHMSKVLSFEDAASVPVVYGTSYECLVEAAHLRAGEKVLIHAAAGGVGQAAIIISKWIGAEIFCTVSTPEKKEFIMHTYDIPEDHIFSSRSPTFAEALLTVTECYGVDVVLNSVAGEMLHASWKCLATFGRFVEIGKKDLLANTYLEMLPFDKGVSYVAVDLSLLIEKKGDHVQYVMSRVMDLIDSKAFRPVSPIQTMDMADLESAFRTMQAGKHIGKIVLTSSPDTSVLGRCRLPSGIPLRHDATYIITGGTGGLGRALVKWFVDNGAKNIVLASRSGGKTPSEDLRAALELACAANANIRTVSCDVSSVVDVQNLIATTTAEMPPVRGVIHGAMVLKVSLTSAKLPSKLQLTCCQQDALFENAAHEDWSRVINPKILGAMNLHNSLEDQPLDFFICLSSAAAIMGNAGQASYAGSNSVLDAFCRWRGARGLPATSINLPAITDAGYVAEMIARGNQSAVADLYGASLTNSQFHLVIEAAAVANVINASANANQSVVGIEIKPDLASRPSVQGPLLAYLRKLSLAGSSGALPTANTGPGSNGRTGPSLKEALSHLTDYDTAFTLVAAAMADKIASIMMIPAEEVTLDKAMADLGLDSLVAVEFRNWMARELDASVPMMEIVSSGPLRNVVGMAIEKSTFIDLPKPVVGGP